LYNDIKENGCKTPPVVTEDGCRIDGSHRASIIVHLGEEYMDVNLVRYDRVFPKIDVLKILSSNKKYRQNYYKFKE